jgi:hypothetical protein
MLVVADIEADGLDPDKMESIHCMVFIDPEDNQMYEFHDRKEWKLEGSLWFSLEFLETFLENQVTNLVGHNFTGYDLPVLEKVYGIHYKRLLTDTLVWSRCLYPDRPKPHGYAGKDNHGLGSWGHRLGRGKPEHNEWEVFTEDMLHRCREDVEINVMVFGELLGEMFCRNTGDAYDPVWIYSPPKYPEWIMMETAFARAMDKQERDGVYFDEEGAVRLIKELSEITERIEGLILPQLPPVRKVSYKEKKFPACADAPFTNSGAIKANVIKYYVTALDYFALDGKTEEGVEQLLSWLKEEKKVRPTKVVTEKPMKIKSPQFKVWLEEALGWQPTEWNTKMVSKTDSADIDSAYYKQQVGRPARDKRGKQVKASPKLTEDSYDSIDGALGPEVKTYLVASHRRSLVEGLLKHLREDQTLPAGMDSCGASTTRVKHRVVANIPRTGSAYGEECRALFTARPGRVLVGADASALEARITGHYTYPYDDGAYATELLEGDIHTKNAIAFGLITEELAEAYRAIKDTHHPETKEEEQIIWDFSCGRNGGGPHGGGAKAGLYCLSYGGGAPKLAETLNKPKEQGQAYFDLFWEANWALAGFKADVEQEWKHNAEFIQALDGRWLPVRSQHSLVNLKIQSGGSIVCKTATVFAAKALKKKGLDSFLVINYHDEMMADCHPDCADEVEVILTEAFEKAGKYWELLVPTPGDSAQGQSWKDVH